MLQTMRHLAHSWVFKGLMIFLVLSFGIWGIGDIFRGNPLQRTVAKTGKDVITVQALNHEFDLALRRARQAMGSELTPQQARQAGLLDQTLKIMVQKAEVGQDLKRLGIDVPEKVIVDRIKGQDQFRGKDGRFDRAAFEAALEKIGMNEQSFLDTAREELARQQLTDALASGNKIPKTISDNVYRARAQKRIFDVVTLKNAEIGGIPAPGDAALQDFYQKNAAQFTAPETRGLTIATLATDEVAKDINVSDDDVKKAFESRKAEFAQPERRDILQVVLQDEDKAKRLAASARASGNLTSAAKSAQREAVPLDKVDQQSILPDLAQPVFALPAGKISDPIKSSLGWHIVQVKKIYPAGEADFKELKEGIRAEMKRDMAIENVTRILNQLDDSLAAGHALEDIADSLRLRLVKIPSLTAAGKTPDGKDPAELPGGETAVKAAFGQNSGEVSPVMDDKKGNYSVVRTDEVTPSAVIPFDKVKDQVAAGWKAEEQAKKARTEAENIAKSLRDGKPASSFAAEAGASVRVSKPISVLGDSDSDLPQALMPQILKIEKGGVSVSSLPDRQIILRLSQTIDADPAAGGVAAAKVADETAKQRPAEFGDQYLKYLRVLFPVEIDESLMETLRQQGS